MSRDSLRVLFDARAQVVVGVSACAISLSFWVLGTLTISHAASWPWNWTPAAFIFHASMFALMVGSYAIVSTGLGYKATERVEAQVVNDAEEVGHADRVGRADQVGEVRR